MFSEGKDFTASGLRHMAYRLKAQRPPMRLARVTVSAPVVTGCTAESAVVIEVGAARVAIRSGFSPGTLTAVLDVLERRGAR